MIDCLEDSSILVLKLFKTKQKAIKTIKFEQLIKRKASYLLVCIKIEVQLGK